MNKLMGFETLLNNPWFSQKGTDQDVVVASRLRIARNLKEFPFPIRIKQDQVLLLENTILSAVKKIQSETKLQAFELSSFSSSVRKILVERSVFSQGYSVNGDSFLISDDGSSLSILLNDVDHLRMQSFKSGLALDSSLEELQKVDLLLEKELSFAASIEYGYLTTKLQDLGTGLKASIMLHLPALSMAGLLEKTFKSILKQNYTISGFYGSLGDAKGSLYQIATSSSFADSEEAMISSLKETAQKLIQYERLTREELLEHTKVPVLDAISRSFGTINYAVSLSYPEAVDCLSNLKLGISLGLIKNASPEQINAILYTMQNAHLESFFEGLGRTISPGSFDELRALFLKKILVDAQLQGVY